MTTQKNPSAGDPTPQQRAEQAAQAMWADDNASQALGMQIEAIGPGTATISMTVRADMTNGHGMCHGGYVFMLADSTFAFACNSHNQRAVAASAEVHFLAPAQDRDVLTAVGQEVHRGGRSGVYDIRVTNQDDKLIAVFRGKSANIRGQLVE